MVEGTGDATEDARRTIAVCVSTFRRPQGLTRLIDALGHATIPRDVDVVLVVVDNDGEGPTVSIAPPEGWGLVSVVEPQRGIPFSRNRAVREAGDVDAIVFFDDDEQPEPDCIATLLRVWEETGADVVQGSSTPEFDEPPPGWIVEQGYFERSFDGDGIAITGHRARTSNVLVSRAVFDVADPPFDTRLRLSGGSDSFLFRTAESAGHTFVSAASALVVESVPASRVDPGWLVRRQYRTGWGRSFHLRAQNPPLRRRIKRIVAGLLIMASAPRAAWRARGDATAMLTEGRRAVAYGRGLIVGLVGPAPTEYATTHGS